MLFPSRDWTEKERLSFASAILKRILEGIELGKLTEGGLSTGTEIRLALWIMKEDTTSEALEKMRADLFEGFKLTIGDICPFTQLPIGAGFRSPAEDLTGNFYVKVAENFRAPAELKEGTWVATEIPENVVDIRHEYVWVLQLP
jgi:hypothetical protein